MENKARTPEEQIAWEEMCRHMADKMQSSFGPSAITEPDSDFQNCEYYCQVCHPTMEDMTVETYYDPKNGANIYRCLECGSYRTEEPGFDYFQHGDLIVMDN